ncbi:MAG: hypothetical protein ACRDI2_26450, partial [Chloroflexota bacterium]
ALYRFDCPPALLLGEYELGLVTPEARTQIARHVLDCSRCAEELQVLRSSLAADFLAEAAPEVGLAERVRRVVATLFVPPPSPAYAALRGPGQDAARTYHADGLSITLGPGPQAQRGRVALIGLIVQEDAAAESLAGSQAHLIAPGGESETAEIDELGNFGFDDIAPGTYQIELRLPGQIVVIEDVGVGT